MNYLKSILITTFFVSGAFNLPAQNSLSIHGIRATGEPVGINDVFLLNDACTFYVQDDDTGEKQHLLSSKWRLLCRDKDGHSDIVEREIDNQSEFSFLLDDLRLGTDSLRRMLRIKSNSDNSVYFGAYISCHGLLKNGKTVDLQFPVYLNLLPSVPSGEIVNSYQEGYYIYLDIACASERSENRGFILTEYEGPRRYTYVLSIETPLIYNVWVDSQHYTADYYIASFNRYGWVTTERIAVPQYVNNGNGLDEIDYTDLISFYPNPFQDELNISGEIDQISSLRIYDVNGRLVKQLFRLQTDKIHLEELPAGIYIMSVELNGNKSCRKYKLLKK